LVDEAAVKAVVECAEEKKANKPNKNDHLFIRLIGLVK
jgi:hypothetical protein